MRFKASSIQPDAARLETEVFKATSLLAIVKRKKEQVCNNMKVQGTKCRICGKREAGNDGLCDHCRRITLLQEIDRDKLPWYYRLILNIPVVSSVENASGVFWGIIVPAFAMADMWLNLYLFFALPFPINVIVIGIVPITVLIIFIRVSIDRFINFWNLTVRRSHSEWNIEERVQEYITLLNKKADKKEQKI